MPFIKCKLTEFIAEILFLYATFKSLLNHHHEMVFQITIVSIVSKEKYLSEIYATQRH